MLRLDQDQTILLWSLDSDAIAFYFQAAPQLIIDRNTSFLPGDSARRYVFEQPGRIYRKIM